jgi:hypothetical protein
LTLRGLAERSEFYKVIEADEAVLSQPQVREIRDQTNEMRGK